MSPKQHILIILAIIGSLTLLWKVYVYSATPVQEEQVPSPYSISIARASWGLNCLNQRTQSNRNSNIAPYAYDQQNKVKFQENNALESVSRFCNGKSRCIIRIAPDLLGSDPMPECSDKELEIEYRCFKIDRPWSIRAKQNETLDINCTNR